MDSRSDVAALQRWALGGIARLEAGNRLTSEDADYLRSHLPMSLEDRARFQRDVDLKDQLTQDGFRLGWAAGDDYTQTLYDALAAALPSRALAAAVPAPVHRAPRSRRVVSRGRARGPDPEPEPPRLCAGCGGELKGRRKDARTHNDACRKRASRSAHAPPDRWLLADALAIEEKALALVRAGEMTGFDALALVLWPTDRIRAALEEIAA